MITLLELYDERLLANEPGVEGGRPERVIYICAEGGAERMNRLFLSHPSNNGIL